MSFNIIVLAKQVPDTRNVGKDAMKADGTVNRGALPAIFNPEDLNALEQALQLKDRLEDVKIHILTMGPARAAEIIRESLYRGADVGYLLSGREFAGSDTLATSYALAAAIHQIGKFDLILCGRQAIDGDTAQVGPQVAEKLTIPQITYVESIEEVKNGHIVAKRRIERGTETVKGKLPLLITVNGTADQCRPRNAKRIMKYKYAKTPSEMVSNGIDYVEQSIPTYLTIHEWGVMDIEYEPQWLGLSGSPTKVKKVENIVFTSKENKQIGDNDHEIEALITELIANHTIG